jgi:hypothetical protein
MYILFIVSKFVEKEYNGKRKISFGLGKYAFFIIKMSLTILLLPYFFSVCLWACYNYNWKSAYIQNCRISFNVQCLKSTSYCSSIFANTIFVEFIDKTYVQPPNFVVSPSFLIKSAIICFSTLLASSLLLYLEMQFLIFFLS